MVRFDGFIHRAGGRLVMVLPIVGACIKIASKAGFYSQHAVYCKIVTLVNRI
jgi:hypothetical protein